MILLLRTILTAQPSFVAACLSWACRNPEPFLLLKRVVDGDRAFAPSAAREPACTRCSSFVDRPRKTEIESTSALSRKKPDGPAVRTRLLDARPELVAATLAMPLSSACASRVAPAPPAAVAAPTPPATAAISRDWSDRVLYFVVDRFSDGDPGNSAKVDRAAKGAFPRGDLKGLRAHLDEVADLGVTPI
jgi:hypothetical protein